MSDKVIRVTDKDGDELVFRIDTDPNYEPATEYYEDGYWISEDDEEGEE